jgi:hypothetical protein
MSQADHCLGFMNPVTPETRFKAAVILFLPPLLFAAIPRLRTFVFEAADNFFFPNNHFKMEQGFFLGVAAVGVLCIWIAAVDMWVMESSEAINLMPKPGRCIVMAIMGVGMIVFGLWFVFNWP